MNKQCSKSGEENVHLKTGVRLSGGNWKRRQGFTLIELIIYIAISTIVLVALLHTMINVLGSREKTEMKSTMQQELRFTMNRISHATTQAVSVHTGASLFGTESGALSLLMSGSFLSPVRFFLSGSQLAVSEAGTATGVITSEKIRIDRFRISNLTATGAAQTVKIELRGTDGTDDADSNYQDAMTMHTSITLRR